ncbi:ribosomal-processing cysteine protease Prp [Peribacillus simplex]|uniref:Ribosomal processing cysteine protease Prp n=1 Tax=Peribacillus simplex TaxID=1478 RepID=A0A9X8ZJ30_9BACI|nr:ribosomal-processing cysteine protease Prp [Peribacillus simplex]TKH04713.1 ribosomal-processing cysteine protease Prp [Peribacillus simplex]TKH13415.1 ribosomal-processing cysteine protease Prp [Peribacillus simplex]
MIKVVFDAPHERIASFTLSGHANFAKKGSDIVCAGVSAVSFGAVNAIMSLTDVEPEIEQGREGGYLRCVIPGNLSPESEEKVQLLLNGMLISLQTIERDYGKYMKIILNQ